MRLRRLGSLWLFLCAALLVGVPACMSRSGERSALLVFAAISLTEALTEIGLAFEKQSDISVTFSYGGSQMLAQQIASGAPADLFFAAGRFPVRFLEERGKIESEATNLLTNRLVLVTRSNGVTLESMQQLSTDMVEHVAIANPALAPVGRYAMESLTNLTLWDDLQGKLVLGADARVTLAYVESGNVDAALVYQTDARTDGDLEVLDIVPLDSYSHIVYPAVVVLRGSDQKALAIEFLEYLRSDAAATVFRKYGFEPSTLN